MLEAQASRRFGGWLAFVNLRAGIAFNALELQDPASPEGLTTDSVNDTAWIWRPGDETDYTLSLGLGVRYDIPVMKTLRK
jgi:hypothetical protein